MTQPNATTLDYAAPKSASRLNWRDEAGLLIVYVILFASLWIASPYFLTLRNLTNILLAVSTIGIISIAMTMVIVAGGIDLSIGSIVAFTGVIAAQLSHYAPPSIAMLAAIVAGLLIGAFNGAAVVWARINPFIVTLATMSIFRGLSFGFSSGSTQSAEGNLFAFLGARAGHGAIFGVPFPAAVMIVLFVLTAWTMSRTVFGRNIYAVGGNIQASRLAGLPVSRIMLVVYSLSGASAGLGGVFTTAQLGAAAPQAAVGLELSVIAAVILGGTSLTGGKGSIWGTLLGVLIMGTLNNGLTLLNVPSWSQDVARGTVLLLAVGLDQLRLRWAAE
jgi:ribose transport system permease protein